MQASIDRFRYELE